jgi:hypothetical protein
MMGSRERVSLALQHQEADRVPLDLGGGPVTGMHVDGVYLLRQALGLDPPGKPVKVIEPFQMLGEIELDLVEALGVDVVRLEGLTTVFGFKNEGWKPWTTFAGTPVLVPAGFNLEPEPNGDMVLYPRGDRSVLPSGRMPKGGFYFDTIVRQPSIDECRLKFEDNLEEFGPISDEELNHLGREAARLHTHTDKAILGNFGGIDIGNAALITGASLKNPKGIRSFEEWFVSTVTRREFLRQVYNRQCDIALSNLEKIYKVVGGRVAAVLVAGMDFGMQTGPLVSPEIYRDLYAPVHRRVNDWIHRNTPWKTFIHSCGSVRAFLEDFIAAGFDVLNPVQCSAAHMDPGELKRDFGDRLTFWGGGVDTQQTLPFGTPEEVQREVQERIRIFGRGGGFVFSTTHNIQARVPIENVLAMYATLRAEGRYPLSARA